MTDKIDFYNCEKPKTPDEKILGLNVGNLENQKKKDLQTFLEKSNFGFKLNKSQVPKNIQLKKKIDKVEDIPIHNDQKKITEVLTHATIVDNDIYSYGEPCPKCGCEDIKPIIYTDNSFNLNKQVAKGDVIKKYKTREQNDPSYSCSECEFEFGDSKNAFSIETPESLVKKEHVMIAGAIIFMIMIILIAIF